MLVYYDIVIWLLLIIYTLYIYILFYPRPERSVEPAMKDES